MLKSARSVAPRVLQNRSRLAESARAGTIAVFSGKYAVVGSGPAVQGVHGPPSADASLWQGCRPANPVATTTKSRSRPASSRSSMPTRRRRAWSGGRVQVTRTAPFANGGCRPTAGRLKWAGLSDLSGSQRDNATASRSRRDSGPRFSRGVCESGQPTCGRPNRAARARRIPRDHRPVLGATPPRSSSPAGAQKQTIWPCSGSRRSIRNVRCDGRRASVD